MCEVYISSIVIVIAVLFACAFVKLCIFKSLYIGIGHVVPVKFKEWIGFVKFVY